MNIANSADSAVQLLSHSPVQQHPCSHFLSVLETFSGSTPNTLHHCYCLSRTQLREAGNIPVGVRQWSLRLLISLWSLPWPHHSATRNGPQHAQGSAVHEHHCCRCCAQSLQSKDTIPTGQKMKWRLLPWRHPHTPTTCQETSWGWRTDLQAELPLCSITTTPLRGLGRHLFPVYTSPSKWMPDAWWTFVLWPLKGHKLLHHVWPPWKNPSASLLRYSLWPAVNPPLRLMTFSMYFLIPPVVLIVLTVQAGCEGSKGKAEVSLYST